MEKISSRREDKKEKLSNNTVKNKLIWKKCLKRHEKVQEEKECESQDDKEEKKTEVHSPLK